MIRFHQINEGLLVALVDLILHLSFRPCFIHSMIFEFLESHAMIYHIDLMTTIESKINIKMSP